jgi:hypothetical protein
MERTPGATSAAQMLRTGPGTVGGTSGPSTMLANVKSSRGSVGRNRNQRLAWDSPSGNGTSIEVTVPSMRPFTTAQGSKFLRA